MSAATQQRDAAIRVAATDVKRAVSLARKIDDPWFRCQALAWSAWYADDSEFDAIVKKSVTSSLACEEPYRVVGSSA